jgi:hypothetical protein
MFSDGCSILSEICAAGVYQEIDFDEMCNRYCEIRKECQDLQKVGRAVIYCDCNLLDAKICIGLKKIMKFQNGKPRWNLCCTIEGEKCCRRQLFWIGSEIGNVKVQQDNINRFVLDSVIDWLVIRGETESDKERMGERI